MTERRLQGPQQDNAYLTAAGGVDAQKLDLERIRQQSSTFNIYTRALYENLASSGLIGKLGVLVDFGTGTGGSLPDLASYASHIIATDIEPEKIEAGRIFVEAECPDRTENFDFHLGGIANLGLDPKSVDVINGRLIWQHLTKEMRNKEMSAATLALKPGGLFVAEDMDLHTWRLNPSTQTFEWFLEKLIKLYDNKGAEPGMGPKLKNLCESNGLEIMKEDSYIIESKGNDPFKNIHLGIFMAARGGLINKEIGVMSEGEFEENMTKLRKEVLNESQTIHTPQMTQIVARKK